MDRAAALRDVIARTPGVAAVLGAILDRRERAGRLPSRLTVAAAGEVATSLRQIFSARAITPAGEGRVRIDLAAPTASDLEPILYEALGRLPRDPRAEQAAVGEALASALAAIAPPPHLAARAFLTEERTAAAARHGDTWRIAVESGASTAAGLVAELVRAMTAALDNDAPLRTANFAARVLGDSKALLPGSDRARRLGAALLRHDPGTQRDVAACQPTSTAASERLALEVRGLLRDDATITVHCAGPLIYAKGGDRFDHVARHAALGDVATLTLQQLRGATLVALPAERITVIENQAPFLDYLERADLTRELVVLARGQASWAVVTLLRLCGRAAPVRHAGDLDRAGVLILRSLAARARVPVEPWHMDLATHRRFAAAGRPITDAERARLADLIAHDDPTAPGHDLLREIAATGSWIEQESFSHLALVPPGDRHARSTTRSV